MLDIGVQAEAEQLLEDLGFNQLPISLDDICNSISKEYLIEVQEQDMQSENINGMSIGDTTQAKILINANIGNAHRRRFTKAHELGHVVLHIQTGRQSEFRCTGKDISSNSGNNNPFEKEANIFASSLLMPSSLISNDIHRNDLSWKLIQDIKNMCDVSLEAAARRVISLSKEQCCLIIHKDNTMWNPIKSSSFKTYVSTQPFPDNLDYSEESDEFPGSLEKCDVMDWRIDDEMELHYSSIHTHNSEFSRTMTLLLDCSDS